MSELRLLGGTTAGDTDPLDESAPSWPAPLECPGLEVFGRQDRALQEAKASSIAVVSPRRGNASPLGLSQSSDPEFGYVEHDVREDDQRDEERERHRERALQQEVSNR